ncbi:hypothetical protein PPYR_08647 [Photinus pyralis]|uniref:Xyloside xylosyltransferase 1 n=1 Tax=Photinus pyralis TaxID=7054 RepID=A0A1Y1LL91_PHOPY|nr:xyloside xylosyltransferase 1-like [Photinus pyralis]KAB0797654.1 hypothetical protein PPYR_08647 [Photinus pyralis]
MNRLKFLIVINLIAFIILVFFYDVFSPKVQNKKFPSKNESVLYLKSLTPENVTRTGYNVWLIFTKVAENSPLKLKFQNLIDNVLNVTSVPLNFHVITDSLSRRIALSQFVNVSSHAKHPFDWNFYDINEVSNIMKDIVAVLTPHFSSKPGTYYSDALFYISLGLYRIAPLDQEMAVILDCDLYFKDDIVLLFREFDRFKGDALFGLAPELSPVYLHCLHKYRLSANTTFGNFYNLNSTSGLVHPHGFQGYNSGVVLLNLRRIRESQLYSKVLSESFVDYLVEKYMFKGHLGDQDFYTLVGYEYPNLIQTLHCGFNRQLCTWWKYHGYNDVFDNYFKCTHKIVILHGNCNTKILR